MDVKSLFLQDRYDNWWSEPRFLNAVTTAAHDLTKKFKGDHYVAVGNSGAWLLFCTELLTQATTADLKELSTTYAAFSGKFMQVIPRSRPLIGGWAVPRTFSYKAIDDSTKIPSPQDIGAYRKYLSSIGLTPTSIIEKSRQGQNTVLIDIFASGEGVASFCKILLDWASESGHADTVAKNLRVANFLYRHKGRPEPGKIKIESYPPIEIQNINPDNYNLEFLSDTSNRGMKAEQINGEPSRERILPYFSFKEWGGGIPRLSNDEVFKKIVSNLTRFFCPNSRTLAVTPTRKLKPPYPSP